MRPAQESYCGILKRLLTTARPYGTLELIAFSIILLAIIFGSNATFPAMPHYPLLAESFLSGSLSFTPESQNLLKVDGVWPDIAPFNGKYYWPLGVFPAVLLMPVAAAMRAFHVPIQDWIGCVQPLLVIAVAALVFVVARRIRFAKLDSGYSAFAFVGASMFLGVALLPWYSYLGHIVAVLLLFGAIAEHLGKRRWWLIGLLIGLAFATRATAGIGIIYFVGHLVFVERPDWRAAVCKLWALFAPFIVVAGGVALYNYLRFESPFETGYAFQILFFESLQRARDYGVFSLIHLPGNIYHAFIAGPLPVLRDGASPVLAFPFIKGDRWGMGIFWTSPYLLLLFLRRSWDAAGKLLLTTCALIAAPIFLYYGVGWLQFGYRYALDFMPFLFLAFLIAYRERREEFSVGIRSVMLISTAANLFLFITLFKIIP